MGVLLTGVFAQRRLAEVDGHTVIAGGLLDRNYKQLYKQLVWVIAGAAWSFFVTYLMYGSDWVICRSFIRVKIKTSKY